MDRQNAYRVDIVSDTHGTLSPTLLRELKGASLIIHAGDMTSEEDYEYLKMIAPVRAVLGNNDFFYDYGPSVPEVAQFEYKGVTFAVSHYRENLPIGKVDVAVCGHTHRCERTQVGSCLVINPGSATFPRGSRGATIARLYIKDGNVISDEFIDL